MQFYHFLFCSWVVTGMFGTLASIATFNLFQWDCEDYPDKTNSKQKGFLFLILGPSAWVAVPVGLSIYFLILAVKSFWKFLGEK